MSERECDRGLGFNERAPWIVPMADRSDGDEEPTDDERTTRPGFNDVVWR